MMFFKKKVEQVTKKKNMADVFEKHLSGMSKAYQTKNYMMSMLVGVGFLMSMQNYFFQDTDSTEPYIAVIKLSGEISAGNRAGSSEGFAKAFSKAMNDTKAKVIVIKANSGGGSPVMAEGINAIIADYKAERERNQNMKPGVFSRASYDGQYPERARLNSWPDIVVSIEDLCASACLGSIISADRITAHKNSLVGSIGVRMDSFGVDGLLQKLGVERQVLTAGTKKDFMDPYKTMNADEKAFIKTELMNPLHKQFIAQVKEARGAKLKEAETPLIFDGMIWTGTQSLTVGLVDDIKTTQQLESELKKIHETTNIVVVQKEPFSFTNLLKSSVSDGIKEGVAEVFTASMAENLR